MLNARMALASCRRVGMRDPRGKPGILTGCAEPGHPVLPPRFLPPPPGRPGISKKRNVTTDADARGYTPRPDRPGILIDVNQLPVHLRIRFRGPPGQGGGPDFRRRARR